MFTFLYHWGYDCLRLYDVFSRSQYGTIRSIKCWLLLYESIYLFILSFHGYLFCDLLCWEYMIPFSSISRWWNLVVFTVSFYLCLVYLRLCVIPYSDLPLISPVNVLITSVSNWKHNLNVYYEKRLCWMLWCSQSTVSMQIIG